MSSSAAASPPCPISCASPSAPNPRPKHSSRRSAKSLPPNQPAPRRNNRRSTKHSPPPASRIRSEGHGIPSPLRKCRGVTHPKIKRLFLALSREEEPLKMDFPFFRAGPPPRPLLAQLTHLSSAGTTRNFARLVSSHLVRCAYDGAAILCGPADRRC